MPLFERNVVYPSDRIGPYVELSGEVVGIGKLIDDSVRLDVRTEHGVHSGYLEFPPSLVKEGNLSKYSPVVGDTAVIRVYDSGGGWYPDNSIVSWNRR